MIETLLQQTSRTFALSIPLLPQPLRDEITIAYLLFRLADTFEDETSWPLDDRLAALDAFGRLLDEPDDDATRAELEGALHVSLVSHEGYVNLLERVGVVMTAFSACCPASRGVIVSHLRRTIAGMAEHVRTGTGPTDLAGVRLYCYHVAGIVGELCTELFFRQSPALERESAELRRLAPVFGEALQLVNILRDEWDDADEGRRFIPKTVTRAELHTLASESIQHSIGYVALLEEHGAAPGIVAFNGLNLGLAVETLAEVERLGPGAKLSRQRVIELHAAVSAAASEGRRVAEMLRAAPVATA